MTCEPGLAQIVYRASGATTNEQFSPAWPPPCRGASTAAAAAALGTARWWWREVAG